MPYGPSAPPASPRTAREQRRRRRRGAVDRRHGVRRVRRRGLRRRVLEPGRRQRRARPARARADRLGDRPGLGGQPRLADLRPRRAVDGVLGRVRVDLLDAVHPAQPGRARASCCAARASPSRRPRGGSSGRGLAERALRALVAADAVLHGHGRRRRRGREGARRQRRRRSRHQLAQPALAADRRAVRRHLGLPRGRVPRQRRPPRRRARPRALLHHPRARRPPSSRARSPSPASSRCAPTRASSTTASPATGSRW